MKETQRKVGKENRNKLDFFQQKEKSNKIVEKLLPLLKDKKKIAIYLPLENEVDVSSLLFIYKQVGIPKVRNSEELDFYLLRNIEETKKGFFNILEPTSNILMDPSDFDCILVPLVAFDKNCNRVGHGKGYYDRYLKKCSCLKIGVAFECQKCTLIEHDENDIRLDYIVSENKIY